VSGIEFSLAVGKAVDRTIRPDCFACNPAHPIIVVDFSPDIAGILRKVWAKAHVAKNVQKYLKRT
jgi:hypothetical protein